MSPSPSRCKQMQDISWKILKVSRLEIFLAAGNFPGGLETIQVVWKLPRQYENFGSLKTFQEIWKLKISCKNLLHMHLHKTSAWIMHFWPEILPEFLSFFVHPLSLSASSYSSTIGCMDKWVKSKSDIATPKTSSLDL